MITFEKAFKEVAYAYYMRGPFMHYNVAKGKGHVVAPEESTSQDYNYQGCALFVMNVYKELLGMDLSVSESAYYKYAKNYLGKRKEVIGYGELQPNGDLYWYGGPANDNKGVKLTVNPSQKYILSQLKTGDIFGYNGHVMLVYDLIYDGNGNIADAYLINSVSSGNGSYYTRTKNHFLSAHMYDSNNRKVSFAMAYAPWSSLYYNYRDRRGVYKESSMEGTIMLETFSERAERDGVLLFDKKNPKNKFKNYYSILRFVDKDGNGNELLNFDGQYNEFKGSTVNGQRVEYPASVKSRVKFGKLYIEKTVDKRDNNVVAANDELKYKIIVKNNSNKDYTDDINVIENLTDYTVYKSYAITGNTQKKSISGVSFKNSSGRLEWNIGKLKSGDEVIINYTVKVKENCEGSTIKSIGTVGGISSGIVKNKIGKNLSKEQENRIKISYESLKNKFYGKTLVNEIYKAACNIDLGLEGFNIKAKSSNDADGLLYFNQKWGNRDWNDETYMCISKSSPFSKMVLNSYFNALYRNPVKKVSYNGINITLYALPSIGVKSNDPDQRANTVFPSDFRTGDVLIYTNENDKTYGIEKGTHNTNERYVTYEDGEYCYIYIEGKGFVGINLGNDGVKGTRDDRNEFNSQYYKNNGLLYYSKIGTPVPIDSAREDWLHYQTVFGKDYYVILRPSLGF